MPEAYPDWLMSPSGSGPDTKKPRRVPGLAMVEKLLPL